MIIETESKLKDFEKQLKSVLDRLTEFADRMGALSSKFEQIGKAFESASKGAFGAGLLELAAKAGKVADDLNIIRDRIAMEFFDRPAQEINRLILGGAEALKKLGAEAERAGLIMPQEALDWINEFNNEIDKLKATAGGTFTQLGAAVDQSFLPALQSLAERVLRLNEQYSLSRIQNAEAEVAAQLELLNRQKEKAIRNAEELGAERTAILEYFALEEQKIRDKQTEAYQASSDQMISSYENFVSALTAGSEAAKEVVKDMVINFISNKQKEILAAAYSASAIAYAMSLATWGASLSHLAVIGSKVLPAIAALEALKAGIKALAQGAIVTGPTLALVGEGRDSEAVLPLNQKNYTELGRNIAAHLPQQDKGRNMEFHFHIGAMIADERGYRQLARKVFSYEYTEKRR